MTSEDITFCSKTDCRNTNCERNQKNIQQHWLDHSYAMFTECEYWTMNGEQKRYAIKKLT